LSLSSAFYLGRLPRFAAVSSYASSRSLTSPPPPRPTVFPYTTLFRSGPPGRIRRKHPHGRPAGHRRQRAHRRDPARVRPALPRLDRKSTRLNSSHVKISYAVFCLKKKNPSKQALTQTNITRTTTSPQQ